MEVAFLVMGALLGAVVGGAVVWRWSDDADTDVPAPMVPSADTPEWDALSLELERGRRFERPFVLVHLPAEAGQDRPEGEVSAVLGSLRGIDFGWVTDDGVDLLLPEVGRDEGEACIARLRELAPKLTTDARMAVFPEDGVTRGALLARLAGNMEALPGEADLPKVTRPFQIPGWAS